MEKTEPVRIPSGVRITLNDKKLVSMCVYKKHWEKIGEATNMAPRTAKNRRQYLIDAFGRKGFDYVVHVFTRLGYVSERYC